MFRVPAPSTPRALTMSDSYSASDAHLTSDDVAAYLGTSMGRSERRRAEAHLATCNVCRAEVLEVRSMLRTAPRHRLSATPLIAVLGAAAAAVLFLTVPWRTGLRTHAGIKAPVGIERTVLSDDVRDSVHVVAPAENAVVASRGMTITWQRGGKDTQFTVTLMDARADIRWTVSTRDSAVTLPDSVLLTADSTYFVYVDAQRADGTSARSPTRSFTIGR